MESVKISLKFVQRIAELYVTFTNVNAARVGVSFRPLSARTVAVATTLAITQIYIFLI